MLHYPLSFSRNPVVTSLWERWWIYKACQLVHLILLLLIRSHQKERNSMKNESLDSQREINRRRTRKTDTNIVLVHTCSGSRLQISASVLQLALFSSFLSHIKFNSCFSWASSSQSQPTADLLLVHFYFKLRLILISRPRFWEPAVYFPIRFSLVIMLLFLPLCHCLRSLS